MCLCVCVRCARSRSFTLVIRALQFEFELRAFANPNWCFMFLVQSAAQSSMIVYGRLCYFHICTFFCDFDFYDGVVRDLIMLCAPASAHCNVPLFLFIVWSRCQRHRWLLCCYYTLQTHFFLLILQNNKYLCLRLAAWLPWLSTYTVHTVILSRITLSIDCNRSLHASVLLYFLIRYFVRFVRFDSAKITNPTKERIVFVWAHDSESRAILYIFSVIFHRSPFSFSLKSLICWLGRVFYCLRLLNNNFWCCSI